MLPVAGGGWHACCIRLTVPAENWRCPRKGMLTLRHSWSQEALAQVLWRTTLFCELRVSNKLSWAGIKTAQFLCNLSVTWFGVHLYFRTIKSFSLDHVPWECKSRKLAGLKYTHWDGGLEYLNCSIPTIRKYCMILKDIYPISICAAESSSFISHLAGCIPFL